MSDRTSPLTALQRQASAALGDVRQAVADLTGILRPERVDELAAPARRLVQGLASVAELAVDPIAEIVQTQRTFVESQRKLADQMTAWAQLQHQLADGMSAWADLQRQIARAMEVSLAPMVGVADVATRLLHEAAGEAPTARPRRPSAATARARPAKKSARTPPK